MFVRSALPCLAAAALLFSTVVSPASAQEVATPRPIADAVQASGVVLAQSQLAQPGSTRADARRPGALVPLYVSFVALQGLDVHSTTRGLSNGGREANPLMKGVAGSPAGLVAVKAASTAGILYGTEKLRKKHPVLAVAMMIGLNSAMAFVVQHNYRVNR